MIKVTSFCSLKRAQHHNREFRKLGQYYKWTLYLYKLYSSLIRKHIKLYLFNHQKLVCCVASDKSLELSLVGKAHARTDAQHNNG